MEKPNRTKRMQLSFTQKSSDPFNKSASTGLTSFKHRVNKIKDRFQQDRSLTNRTIAHITMFVVAVLAIGLSNLDLAWGTISAMRPIKYNPAEPVVTSTEEDSTFVLPTELNDTQNDILVRAAVPRTIIPERSNPQPAAVAGQEPTQTGAEIKIYIVESGDTISGIAEKFGLSSETIVWSNQALEYNPDLLSVGQELIILPIDGVYHQVGGGDTIAGIAATFTVEQEAIINYPLNNVDPNTLLIHPGEWLVVPHGNKPFVPKTVIAYSGPVPNDATLGSGIFGWPASGSITNGYYAYHPGLDVGGWLGGPVLAADSGHVVVSGWDNTGYGNMIVIDHGNGFQTLYAHLQTFYVGGGENVVKGQQIGEVGSTGNSTGPHLHFEIRQGTVQRNPYGFLP